MKKYPAKKVALAGLFLALALIVSLLESLIPPLVPALPYAKLGLANAVLLACFLLVGAGEGFVVLLLKCLLAAVFSGNFAALAWSVPASLAAYAVMIAMCKARIFSVTAVSAAGGMVHNAVQIAVGVAAAGAAVAVYLPYMLLAGAVALDDAIVDLDVVANLDGGDVLADLLALDGTNVIHVHFPVSRGADASASDT